MKPQRCADNDALSAAGIMFAAVTSGSLPKRKNNTLSMALGVLQHIQGTCIRMCFTRSLSALSERFCFLLVDKYEPEGPLARLLKFLILFVAGVAILHRL